MSSCIPLEQLSKIERCSEWDEANESWRISRIQYAGNMRAQGGRSDGVTPSAGSPLRRGGVKGEKKGGAVNVVKAMAGAYFSYDAPVEPHYLAYEDEQ
mmetsp:Transcript_2008/g.5507  ORF Transcript_2008/g.5507 Transcript_2008/m.5507 type:complete len:98 (+) Transcript_2008:2007-2300(+)|eukprot:scaffold152627_cov27-Tisochrysis_lutea.AAC.4